ncbi:MAG TPA: hypothetical protein IAA98_00825 [Candidatus Avipropionibacterium avicola]|uniref:Bacteriocin biosynthesis cyclodehydratase domain-containing protein n=1 Tax=Candidatus Avipropionibacterium avicola TaxID=2840701 RepID=A0A9D1GUP4_9ACTN|nr:hypothetical protein [Candidatus Avipropionibacterium avicola]
MCDVAVIGAGALGQAIATVLHQLPAVTTLLVSDPDPVDPVLYPRSGVATTCAGALVQSLRPRSAGRPRLRVVPHWSDLDHARPALTVVTSSRLEPDRALTEHLVRHDLAHLVVRIGPTAARVGPMVLPGRTPCLNCLDLVQTGADPGWPARLVKECAVLAPAVEPLITWAAGMGAVQVLAQLSRALSDAVGCTLEVDRGDLLTRVRRWPLHPECGCAWWAS